MTAPDWIEWEAARPRAPGLYWWREPARAYGNLELRPEWTAKLAACGMGHAEPQLWPVFSKWDGYKRTVPAGLEWRFALPEDEPVRFPGVALKPCPFTGAEAALVGDNAPRGGCARLFQVPYRPWRFRVFGGFAVTPWHEDPARALAQWNSRVG